eukprot:CAMPEP_0206267304 /NCGR_PEP_ID=MMETSP0047_2-20121206/31073_1 /ASSEMBLY_ACC=CAM_ASM_000192 /TAXON_ID=195065 /ORGANISM="Chroomonas mesostigmatica_cf, Strain CCMP1168" /LENGTH=49 /DNA_ID= /DNA_START= /DNA_END= /DNA_ORIENTATION=
MQFPSLAEAPEYCLMAEAKTDGHRESLTKLFSLGILNWQQAIEYLGLGF